LWIGTERGLLRRNPNGSFTQFSTNDGLADLYVKAILEDRKGELWLLTHNGLSQFAPETRRFRNYFVSNGLLSDRFDLLGDAGKVTATGEILLGSSRGFTLFNPDQVAPNAYVPPVVLTEFLLFNRSVGVGGDSPLQKPIWATNALTLKHDQSIFTIEFAALGYEGPEKNRYRYRLEGLEPTWNEVDSTRRSATYTRLAAGNYVFRVQGSDNDLTWNDAGVRLDVTVLPPWWETWWFKSLAFMALVSLAYATYLARVRGLHAAASQLETLVAQRTNELQVAKDGADAANRAKSAFLANMSHEMRNPLSAVLAMTSLLREEGVSSEQRGYLEAIDRSGEHLLSVINAVLDLAKVEAGEQEALPVSFDIVALARDVVEMLRAEASRKNLTLVYDCAPDVQRFVRADAAKLRQVLLNILGNAIKFTGNGGVTLRLTSRPDQKFLGTWLRFEVEDTGIGIAAEDQARIFEPFVQLDRGQKGTGLGLAITRRFVQMMGGDITVESELGRGSRFRLEIPAQCANAEEEVANTATFTGAWLTLAPGQPECRVLIVEDDLEIGTVMEQMLRRARFEVRLVKRAKEAIEIFQLWKPHFIWMDLWMPEMSGTEAAQRIRQLQDGRNVKIAAMTAAAFESEREQVLAAGMDDFVRKPYRPREIFDCLARHLQVRFNHPEP
jgi:signal transduction histidine kinase/CheY-like chemotaxis protein